MPTATTFGTPVLGQTEKALTAILMRQLAGTGLNETTWVTLTMTVAGGGTLDADELAGVLKVSEARARAHIAALAAAGLVELPDADGAPVSLTEAGQQLHAQIRVEVTEITQRLWGDLPADDLAAAGRVLSTILERANAELAAA